jgi:hypothetical protein
MRKIRGGPRRGCRGGIRSVRKIVIRRKKSCIAFVFLNKYIVNLDQASFTVSFDEPFRLPQDDPAACGTFSGTLGPGEPRRP